MIADRYNEIIKEYNLDLPEAEKCNCSFSALLEMNVAILEEVREEARMLEITKRALDNHIGYHYTKANK